MSRTPTPSKADNDAATGAPYLSVLVPALNEEATLDEVVAAVLDVPLSLEVILVDDGSTDATWAIMQAWAQNPRVTALHHESPRGKGMAVRTALAAARGTVVMVQDADMEYDIRAYPRLLEPIMKGRAQVVYGTRQFAAHTAHSFWYVLGNKGLVLATNLLYNVYLSDINTAYKVMPREAVLAMNLEARGFEFDPEVTAKLLRMGYRIHEVPVDYVSRSREEGKKIKPSDGVTSLRVLLRNRVWKPRHFAPKPVRRSAGASVVGHDAGVREAETIARG